MEQILSALYTQMASLTETFNWDLLNQIVFVLKLISVLISLFFLVLIIYLSKQIYSNFKNFSQRLGEAKEFSGTGLEKGVFSEKWQSVEQKLDSKEEGNYKLAIMEADNMFDDLLKKAGYVGEDMGERLKQLQPGDVSNLDELWEAHKLRNKIAHESGVSVNYNQAKKSIEAYKKAFQSLEAI